MCRHAAYIGPGITVDELVTALPHSLLKQSYQARELLTGSVCADGHGFGWVDPDRDEAGRYASAAPIWSDPNLRTMAPSIRSGLIIAAVRNATIATANAPEDAAPFQHGAHLWSLNGALEDFKGRWRDGPMRDWIAPEFRNVVQGQTDGEHLFAAWLSRIDSGDGPSAGLQALQSLLRDAVRFGDEQGLDVQLNILASDGEHLYATRAGNHPTQNSLYTLQDGDDFPDAWVVASEPLYDDPAWEPVAADSVIAFAADAPPVRLQV